MEFQYQARDEQGQLRTGTVEANNESVAFDVLRLHGLIVIKIVPYESINILERIKLFERVPLKDIVLFSRQLSTLINAKVPIVQALRILETQVSAPKLRSTINEIAQRVEAGDSLSSAMSAYPKIFSELYINLLRSGEMAGTMDESLNYLAVQMEKDYDLRSKVIGAMTYPAFIVVALFIVGFLMFLYVLPPLVAVLQESNVELPITTKALIFTTNFMKGYWWLVLVGTIGSVMGFSFYSKTVGGKYVIDTVKIKSPVIGTLFQKIYMARFARNLSTLIAGGIPIVKALDSVADIVGNEVYKEIILGASTQVRNGKSIASALTTRSEFPPIVAQMTQIGESTGRLQEILEKLASFYEKEVDGVLKILTTLLEPIIMMLLGFAVAVMVAGILLPIYNLASAA
ncbi:MAG: type II secretion system F family protein [Candidatus Doudnabacteria bacterium]|nr:type II secretion system F family protein [Candidatus Doudnabacteria bacterium]